MFDDEIFDGKKFSDLLKEIHTNSKRKEKQINSLIAQLPLIKDYLDVGVKNDDALIKMAGIIQRAISRTATEGEDFKLTVDEKNQLLDTVKKTTNVEWEDEAVKDGKNIKFTK